MSSKIIIELTIREAEILQRAIAGFTPSIEDEMLSVMLHSRIAAAIKRAKSEQQLDK